MRPGPAAGVLAGILLGLLPAPALGAGVSCERFATSQSAQTYLEHHPEDSRVLDADGDGSACDSGGGRSPNSDPAGSTRRTNQEPGGFDLPWWAWTAVSIGVVWLLTRSLRTPRQR